MVAPSLLVATPVLAVLLGLSAFFSSAEMAIFSLPGGTAADPASETDASRTLARLRENPHRLLVTILVGNNVVNIAISSLITVLVVEMVPSNLAVPTATVVVSVLVLIVGEIVPKAYGRGHARTWSVTVAKPLRLVEWVLYPLVAVFDIVTRGLTALLGGDMEVEEIYLEE